MLSSAFVRDSRSDQNVAIEAVLANPVGVTRMDNNTLLFQDKGSGRFKDVKIYPNRIEVLKKGTFGGTPRLSILRTLRASIESKAAMFFCAIVC